MNQRFCNGMVHVIKEGETLYQLSRMYRIPVALLMRANPYVDVYKSCSRDRRSAFLCPALFLV